VVGVASTYGFKISNSHDGPNIVIASQRVGAKRRPMTGSAKQSMSLRKESMDCFGRFAPRNDVGRTSAVSRREAAGGGAFILPS
jgi:hypothetical protein